MIYYILYYNILYRYAFSIPAKQMTFQEEARRNLVLGPVCNVRAPTCHCHRHCYHCCEHIYIYIYMYNIHTWLYDYTRPVAADLPCSDGVESHANRGEARTPQQTKFNKT